MIKLYDHLVARLSRDDEGQTLVEYALIIAMVSIACIAALGLVGAKISAVLNTLTTQL